MSVCGPQAPNQFPLYVSQDDQNAIAAAAYSTNESGATAEVRQQGQDDLAAILLRITGYSLGELFASACEESISTGQRVTVGFQLETLNTVYTAYDLVSLIAPSTNPSHVQAEDPTSPVGVTQVDGIGAEITVVSLQHTETQGLAARLRRTSPNQITADFGFTQTILSPHKKNVMYSSDPPRGIYRWESGGSCKVEFRISGTSDVISELSTSTSGFVTNINKFVPGSTSPSNDIEASYLANQFVVEAQTTPEENVFFGGPLIIRRGPEFGDSVGYGAIRLSDGSLLPVNETPDYPRFKYPWSGGNIEIPLGDIYILAEDSRTSSGIAGWGADLQARLVGVSSYTEYPANVAPGDPRERTVFVEDYGPWLSMGSSSSTSSLSGISASVIFNNTPDPNNTSPIPAPMPDRNPPAPNPPAPDPNAPDPNAQPPTVKPMPRPITSSCKSTMDGPASCNFVVDPLPGSDFPKPGDVVAAPDFATPDFAPMPVIDVNFPEMPPIGCNLPDFTNMSDCPPVPGTGGPLPGGRDRRGKRGINPNIKTGGKTHGKRRKVFPGPKHSGPHKRCFPAGTSCMGAITELLIGVGISPLDIVFQIGPEWDKQLRREKCFRRGVSRLDAAAWFASKLMCRIIDEGPPTHNVYIGPPHHRPGQKTWTFDEHFDLFAVSHSSTSEGSYHAVEVFGDHFREPYPISLVENPFASPDESEILQIEVGPDYTRREAEQLAAFRAAALRRASVSVQASVPYSEEYMMRDRMILRAPDRGFQETYLIYGKQSDLSPEGRIHILTGVLPATAREMEQFPRVS